MKTAPIAPGQLAFSAEGTPRAGHHAAVRPGTTDALARAHRVFLAGNRLPQRWADRERFVILETGFGLGNTFLATWDAWRRDPQRCQRLVLVSIEKHPLVREDLARAHEASALPDLARQLVAAWPLHTPNLHPLAFEDGRVQLLLGFGDIGLLLPQIVASVDAFFLDDFPAARGTAAWDVRVLKRLGRLAGPGATAATWNAASAVQEGLRAAGFTVEGGRRHGTTVARYAPRHPATAPPGGWHRPRSEREAVVIGGGLAGCAAAWALSLQGWHCRVLDREGEPAAATSGNVAGLFHGSFHKVDGPHARAHRAAALLTQRVAAEWMAQGRLEGQLAGCLRLESRLDASAARAALAEQGLDRGYVEWLDRDNARRLCGLALPGGAWSYPGGGWLAPRRYAQEFLARSGAAFVGGTVVERIGRSGGIWQVFDRQGELLAEAPVLVLANGAGAKPLLASADAGDGVLAGLSSARGQISSVASGAALPCPRLPVAGHGYVLPPIGGQLVFGATQQPGDEDPQLREADHHANLAQLARLCGGSAAPWTALPWEGRVGWRAVTRDRLPLIGAVPDADALGKAAHIDTPRFVPRLRDAEGGLYLFTGLGSRGIAWAALGGQLLASWISGAPCPVEADLRDALDPARELLRRPSPGERAARPGTPAVLTAS